MNTLTWALGLVAEETRRVQLRWQCLRLRHAWGCTPDGHVCVRCGIFIPAP